MVLVMVVVVASAESSNGILAGIVTRSVGLLNNKMCLMPRQLYLSNLRVHFDCTRRVSVCARPHATFLWVFCNMVWIRMRFYCQTNNSFS